MASPPSLAAFVRRHDRDRYLTALFAPAERRDALLALYAFNYEVAKTREIVHEPVLGRIRLQWWRESLDAIYAAGAVRSHEVVTPLAEAIRRHGLSRGHFDRLIDARELDLAEEPPATVAALEAYCEDTSGRLQLLALEALGVRDPASEQAARAVGTGYALVGLVRAIPFHARLRRQYIPADLATEVGLDLRTLFELKPSAPLAAAVERLVARADTHLAAARARAKQVPVAALPALLPARLASGHLRDLRAAGFDAFDRRLTVGGKAGLRLAGAMLTRRY
jgi:NADH dehydrogenase [ubiquinone] 1 alpha subcomplex assembly factor 6